MRTHVAFLRAVNLGKRRVGMAHLVELAGSLGHSDVWTHVNSGNVVFRGSGRRAALEHAFEAALERDLGFEVTTFVRTPAELRRTLALEPFAVAPGDTYFVTFLKERPSDPQVRALEALSNDFDTLVVQGRDVHWLMRGKSIDTKLKAKAWADGRRPRWRPVPGVNAPRA
jgi:uncharacterized protein (DUF1697 family)